MAPRRHDRCFVLLFLIITCVGVHASKNLVQGKWISRLEGLAGKDTGLASIEDVGVSACDLCLQLSSEAQMVLSDPDTSREAILAVDQFLCEPLQPGLKSKCNNMVEGYVPELLLELEAYLGPDKLCVETGLCKPQKLLALDLDKKTCAVCQDLASDALTFLEANKTQAGIVVALHLACTRLEELSKQCHLLVDLYAPNLMQRLENTTPQEFCQLTKLCKAPSVSLKRNDCVTCEFVVLEIKIKLKDPKTQAKMLELLVSGCNKVPNHVEECKAIIEEYGPFILANLDTLLDADVVCCRIGACQSSKCKTKLSQQALIELPQLRPLGRNAVA